MSTWSRILATGAVVLASSGCFNGPTAEDFGEGFTDFPPPPDLPCGVALKPGFAATGVSPMAQPAARGTADWQPWSSGHALAVHGDTIYAVDRDNGTLVRLARQSLSVLETVPVGAQPEQVVVGPDGVAFVSVRGAGTVVKLPADGGAPVTYAVGIEPVGLALSPSGNVLYVVLAGENAVSALQAATGAELGRGKTGARPVAVAASPNMAVVVTHQAGEALMFTASDLVAAAKGNGVVATGSIAKLGGQTLANHCGDAEGTHATRALAAAVDPETGAVHVAHTLVAPGTAKGVVLAAMSPEQCSGSGIQGGGGGGGGGGNSYGAASTGCKFGPRRPVDVAVSRFGLTGKQDLDAPAVPVANPASNRALAADFDQPSDIGHHPTHRLLFVAALGTDNVLVLHDLGPGQTPQPFATIHAGVAPRGIAFAADGTKAYVLNAHGFSVGEVDLAPLFGLTAGALTPPLELSQSRETAIGTDPLPAEARLGRKVFHDARNPRLSAAGQFACATCHLDGTEDKQVWFIADGPRQTPALAGRLEGTAPFNWKGTEAELKNNMKETIHRMGGTGLTQAELDSLELFLLVGLQPPPNPHLAPTGLTEQQLRGKALFEDMDVGCAGCHVPGAGTDGKLHDVGTANEVDVAVADIRASLQGAKPEPVRFNTPTLRGLHYTAPYLHDGSAATLLQVLDRTATTMGHTAHLDAGQKQDLVAYLLTL